MKKLIAVAAISLAFGGFFPVPAARAAAAEQRGSHDESRTLIGHVLSAQGPPQQKAIVYLKNTRTLAIKTYISEADGGFRFSGLAPNIDYEVYAEHEGSHSDIKTLSGFDSRKEVTVTLKIHSGK
ncbi:MAG TPA: carboxypeptidase-like regulatory domain-containing protein [Candidatus Angelobacter sp.]